VTKIDRRGHQYRIASGLASMANTPNNDNAIGPHGIMVLGDDRVFITNGGPTEPKVTETGPTIFRETLADQNPVASLFGRVVKIGGHGYVSPRADIWGFERAVNPDKATGNPAVDSNPVDLFRDGSKLVVADAGGNAIDTVDQYGGIRALTTFANRPGVPNPFGGPPISMQAVPTSVEQGRDGQYYVSQLTGFPFPVGGANIYRVNPATGAQTVFASGFTNLMDLAFGRHGTLYAIEIDHDSLLGPANEGALFAISPNGTKRRITLPAGALPFPGGITVHDDDLYVTINSGSPGGGQVVRLRLP
jgi:hypothetical protein